MDVVYTVWCKFMTEKHEEMIGQCDEMYTTLRWPAD